MDDGSTLLPLSRYLDGRLYTLRLGTSDAVSKTRQAIYRQARKMNVKVLTRAYRDGVLEVQVQR